MNPLFDVLTGTGSPHKFTSMTPSKAGSSSHVNSGANGNSSNSKEDFMQFYKESGLDSLARDVSVYSC